MTPLEAASDLLPTTNWQRRVAESGTLSSFGRADFSFGDVVSATENKPFERYSLDVFLWAYGMLVGDTTTSVAVLSRIYPPLTDAFVDCLKSTPLADQEMGDLARFMGLYSKARGTGRIPDADVLQIGRIMAVMAVNFAAKVKMLEKADYTGVQS